MVNIYTLLNSMNSSSMRRQQNNTHLTFLRVRTWRAMDRGFSEA